MQLSQTQILLMSCDLTRSSLLSLMFMKPQNFYAKKLTTGSRTRAVAISLGSTLQHCIRPQSSQTSLYGRLRTEKLPYKEVTELWSL